MTMQSIGHFELYTPAKTDQNAAVLAMGALFAKNADGQDWYGIAHSADWSGTAVMVKDGIVCAVDPDPTKLFPAGADVYAVDPSTNVEIGMVLADGAFAEPAPTEADYGRAVQAMLDAKARERNYDSIATAVSYRDDPNATYAAEGKALFDWRSAVWTYAYAQLAAVTAGMRTQPTVADFVTEVQANCPFAWPASA